MVKNMLAMRFQINRKTLVIGRAFAAVLALCAPLSFSSKRSDSEQAQAFKKSVAEICQDRAKSLELYLRPPPPPRHSYSFPKFDMRILEPLCILAKYFGRDDLEALAVILVESKGNSGVISASSNAAGILQYVPTTYAQAIQKHAEAFKKFYPQHANAMDEMIQEADNLLQYRAEMRRKIRLLEKDFARKKAAFGELRARLKKLRKKARTPKSSPQAASPLQDQIAQQKVRVNEAYKAILEGRSALAKRLREFSEKNVAEDRQQLTVLFQLFDYLASGRDYIAHFSGQAGAVSLRNLAEKEAAHPALFTGAAPEKWPVQFFTLSGGRRLARKIVIAVPPPELREYFPAFSGMRQAAASNESIYFYATTRRTAWGAVIHVPRKASAIIEALNQRVTIFKNPIAEWMAKNGPVAFVCPRAQTRPRACTIMLG